MYKILRKDEAYLNSLEVYKKKFEDARTSGIDDKISFSLHYNFFSIASPGAVQSTLCSTSDLGYAMVVLFLFSR